MNILIVFYQLSRKYLDSIFTDFLDEYFDEWISFKQEKSWWISCKYFDSILHFFMYDLEFDYIDLQRFWYIEIYMNKSNFCQLSCKYLDSILPINWWISFKQEKSWWIFW